MVEVAPGKERLIIPVWKYLLFLAMFLILLFIILYYLLASNYGARNSWLESLKRYLRIAGSFSPNIKPEDNFADSLRIHGFEKAGSKRYYLFVSATDNNGSPIKVVQPNEVKLLVKDTNGKQLNVKIDRVRPLHLYSNWVPPMTFANVMDYSGSMFPQDIQAIEDNLVQLLHELVIPAVAAVIKFNDRPREILNLSEDNSQIIDAIRKSVPLQNTALYDGIDKGVEKIQAQPHFKFIILTTDGNDNASISTIDDALRRCAQHNVSIFAFGFGWLDVKTLKKLAEETEGYYSYVPDSSNLDEWFKKLGHILNNIQVIEFSTDQDINAPGETQLTIDNQKQKLSRIRTWN